MAILALCSILEGIKKLARFALFAAFWALLLVGLILSLLAGVKQPVEVQKVRIEHRTTCWQSDGSYCLKEA